MAQEQQSILNVSLADYKRQIDNLRASLIGLDKTSQQYEDTVKEIRGQQQQLNEVMAIGQKDSEKTLQQQLRDERKKLMLLQEGTAEYQKQLQVVGNLQDRYVDMRAAIKNAADDARLLNTAIDIAKVGTSMYGAWTSAAAIFGAENEKVVESIQKLQAATTLLNSLKQIQLALFDRGSRIYQLYNKVVKSTTASENAQATATTALSGAQKANTAATGAATVATNLFKKALIATGIGAIAVAIGTLIANWDKLTSVIGKAVGTTEDYSNANEDLEASFEKANHEADNQIKLMKAEGATELEVLEYKKKLIEAQIAEVNAKIADIEATNAQIREGNKWYKAITKIVKGALDYMSAALKPLLFAWDKIFGTDSLDGFQAMIDKAAHSFSDMLFGIGSNDKEIQELKGHADELKQSLEDINVDIKVAGKGGKGGKGGKSELEKYVEQQKKAAKEAEEALKRDNSQKRIDAQVKYLNGLITEKEYKEQLLGLDRELKEGYSALTETYKDVAEIKQDLDNKTTDAVNAYNLNKAQANADQRKELEEKTAKQIEETYKDALSDIDFKADQKSLTAEIEFDAKTTGLDSGNIKYIEAERELEHQLFEIREQARQEEIAATQKAYDDKIALAAGNKEEIERLTKEKNTAIAQIELEGQKDSFDLMKKDKKATADSVKAKKEQYKQLAASIQSLMGTINDIMTENLRAKVENGEMSEEEAEKEFERQKTLQYGMALLSTIGGAAEAYETAQRLGPPMGPIIGAVNMAAALATGMAQVMQIKNSKFGQESSASASAASTPTVQDVSVSPILNEKMDVQTMTAMNVDKIANNGQNTRVWIAQSDLEKSGKQVEIRQSETSF